MSKSKDRSSVSGFLSKYDPLRLPPMDYAKAHYTDELISDLKKDKNLYLATAGGGIVFGILVSILGYFFGVGVMILVGLGLSLVAGYIVPRFVGTLWVTYRKAYKKSEDALEAWEKKVGVK